MIDRARIAALIPHAGKMCLLERVVQWDAESILCTADSHHDPQNPLAYDGQLSSACGVEYAAQAMALHGALVGANVGQPRMGYLASVRALTLDVARLDDVTAELVIEVVRIAGNGNHMSYRFTISAAANILLYGRAAVVLDAIHL